MANRILVGFGLRVRRLRHNKGWSQEELAVRSGLHRTYVGAVERGERNISLLNIGKLARALGEDTSTLTARLPLDGGQKAS